ncbi:MAG: TSUP family transporter [Acidimicrobiales bacterium]
MELWTLALIIIVVFIGAVFQASIGFGANVIAQPIVYLLEPSLVPGSILLANALLGWLVMLRDRQAVDQRPVTGAVVGLLAGTTIGIFVIRAMSPDSLAILISISVLVMVALLAGNRVNIAPSSRSISLAALAGGFAGTTAGIGGPPMALVYKDAEGPTVRGSLASYFILSSPVALAGLAIAGRFGWRELLLGLSLFPVTTAGFFASGPLLPLVDRGATKPAILAASALAAVILLVRTVAT